MADLNLVKGFLDNNHEWAVLEEMKHLEAEKSENRCNFFFGARVELHSLTSTDLNSAVGIVGKYLGRERDRFEVAIIKDGEEHSTRKPFAVRSRNLRLLDLPKKATPPVAIQTIVEDYYFAPGMLYLGTIQIPGDAGFTAEFASSRQEYVLTIIGSDQDEEVVLAVKDGKGQLLEERKILARHRAYGDEQYVYIKIKVLPSDDLVRRESFTIEYQDGETICHGRWDPSVGCFTGSVSQMVNTDEKIYHPSDEITHTFTLRPSYSLGAATGLCRHMNSTTESSRNCLRSLAALRRFGTEGGGVGCIEKVAAALSATTTTRSEPTGERQTFLEAVDADARELADRRKLLKAFLGPSAEVRWKDLVVVGSREVERCCARFRRFADCLDALSFDSPEHKNVELAHLTARGGHEESAGGCGGVGIDGERINGDGLSVEVAHTIWDTALYTLLAAVEGWGLSERRLDRALSLENRQMCENRLAVAHQRLTVNFERFSSSLHRAEARLTRATIALYALSSKKNDALLEAAEGTAVEAEQESSPSDDCAICMGEAGDDSILKLPCSHYFHRACITQWLHNHPQCPICRFDLKELDLD